MKARPIIWTKDIIGVKRLMRQENRGIRISGPGFTLFIGILPGETFPNLQQKLAVALAGQVCSIEETEKIIRAL